MTAVIRGLALAVAVLVAPALALAQGPSGEALYKARCAACHDNGDARTPPRQALQNMTPSRILRTLDFGAMMTIAYTLRRDEREAVANFLGKPGPEPRPRPEAYCADRSVRLRDVASGAWNGWSPARDNARFVPAPLAALTAAQVPKLKLNWA